MLYPGTEDPLHFTQVYTCVVNPLDFRSSFKKMYICICVSCINLSSCYCYVTMLLCLM